jgi:hypothetical protein
MSTRVVHVHDNVPGAVYIGRANGHRGLKASPWANPHKIGPQMTRSEAVWAYYEDLTERLATTARQGILDDLYELRGKPLACWCRHDGEARTADNMCHGDAIVAVLRDLGWEESS